MELTEAALKKLTKVEIIKLILDLQDNFNQDVKCIKKDLSELRENFSKLEAELAVTKQINSFLRSQIVQVECLSDIIIIIIIIILLYIIIIIIIIIILIG